MKLPRTYLIATLLLAFSVGANSQEPPKAVLIDEFGEIPCGDLKSRTDIFFTELSQHPADLGHIIIPNTINMQATVLIIRASTFTRQFDRNRLRFYVASESKSARTQFWRIPPGAETTKSKEIKNSHSDSSKAFKFGHSERHDAEGVCPTFAPDEFAELLEANPGSRARLVIFGHHRHRGNQPRTMNLKNLDGLQRFL